MYSTIITPLFNDVRISFLYDMNQFAIREAEKLGYNFIEF
jgi:hypothetical protein